MQRPSECLSRQSSHSFVTVSDDLPEDLCFARGFGGQLIAIAPSQGAVIVMLNGAYTDETAPIIHLMGDILTAAAPAPAH